MHRNRLAIPVMLCAMLMSGCMTTGSKCLVTVSNSSDNPVTDVVVEVGGIARYTAPAIEPHSDAAYKPLREGMAAAPKVSWKSQDGKLTSKELKLARVLPADFHGRVLFQIDGKSGVKMFVMPADDANGPLIPWGYGEFDPTIMIPGMNQQ